MPDPHNSLPQSFRTWPQESDVGAPMHHAGAREPTFAHCPPSAVIKRHCCAVGSVFFFFGSFLLISV